MPSTLLQAQHHVPLSDVQRKKQRAKLQKHKQQVGGSRLAAAPLRPMGTDPVWSAAEDRQRRRRELLAAVAPKSLDARLGKRAAAPVVRCPPLMTTRPCICKSNFESQMRHDNVSSQMHETSEGMCIKQYSRFVHIRMLCFARMSIWFRVAIHVHEIYVVHCSVSS